MAQSKVTEFFAAKKGSNKGQAAKRRKLNVEEIDIQSSKVVLDANTRSTRSRQRVKLAVQPVDDRPENQQGLESVQKDAVTIRGIIDNISSKATRNTRKIKAKSTALAKTQHSLENFITASGNKGEITEETTSSWDDHDVQLSCPLTPPKQLVCENQPDGVSRKRTLRGKVKMAEDASPAKAKCMLEEPESSQSKNEDVDKIVDKSKTKAKRRLTLKIPVEDLKSRTNTNDLPFELPKTPPPVSPLPDTPEEVRKLLVKGPDVPTSSKVQRAIEQCKLLMDKKAPKTKSKITAEAVKSKLSKCGKLEELKSQLAEIGEISSKLKNKPKIEKFDEIKVEVDIQPKTENVKAPAYERFDALASPAPPTLSLPYKYRVLAEMFRGMDTVVSMMHNRQELCTYLKLKAAVQTMTKRNFEETYIGQIKTVYPKAYLLRQEKGLPMFGNKTSDYQLTIEVNLEEHMKETKCERQTFSASHLLRRRTTFHSSLIDIVKKHHRVFLSKLDRPLNVPDEKITRWHPKFQLDEVPDVETSPLPQPPFVKKYQSANDVFEETRGRILPRVEKALESVALESKTNNNLPPKPVKTGNSNEAAFKGVPAFLLEKIRAKEAQKLEEAMMKDPKENHRTIMMRRLPEMIRMLRTYFITEKKPSLVFEAVAQKMVESYKSCISIGDMGEHIKLMLELIPEWLTMVEIKRGKYLKIDRNLDLVTVTDKINNILKGR
ncbi:hypothetical protein ScPMuIL_001518 [Solemya velum]